MLDRSKWCTKKNFSDAMDQFGRFLRWADVGLRVRGDAEVDTASVYLLNRLMDGHQAWESLGDLLFWWLDFGRSERGGASKGVESHQASILS